MAYIGFSDQFYRKLLLKHFKAYFDEQGLLYKHGLSLVEFLSLPSDRMIWSSHNLSDDELSLENAII